MIRILSIVALLAVSVSAQFSVADLASQHGVQLASNGLNLSPSGGNTENTPSTAGSFIIDKAIDSSAYRIGAGDVFSVYIWGNMEKQYSLKVNGEGRVMIPLIGSIQIGGLVLKDARDTIRARIKSTFRNVSIDISLSEIRRFKVHVFGQVEKPGTFVVDGMTRVDEAIAQAHGFLKTGDKRRVMLIGAHDTSYADLSAYVIGGQVSKNPYIDEGQDVYVPSASSTISVTGAVNCPDEYDFVPGESVAALVAAAGGTARGVDSTKIIVTRFVNNEDSISDFEISFTEAAKFLLQPDDRVRVCFIPQYREHLGVVVCGEVKYPGSYPIRNDKTRVVDVIAMAGGLTEDAYLPGSKIIRREMTTVGSAEFLRLKTVPAPSLNPLERSYLKAMQTQEDGRVSIDFDKLFAKGNSVYNILLRSGDSIIVARVPLSVKVMGAVVAPGQVSYEKGKDYRYYVEQAGGFGSSARRNQVRIIKGGSEVMLRAHDRTLIEAGDAIWIPEKGYHNGFEMTKDIIMIIGSVATIILAGFTVYKMTN